jgi:hypothetical protein
VAVDYRVEPTVIDLDAFVTIAVGYDPPQRDRTEGLEVETVRSIVGDYGLNDGQRICLFDLPSIHQRLALQKGSRGSVGKYGSFEYTTGFINKAPTESNIMSLPAIFQKVCEKNGWSQNEAQLELDVDGDRKQKVIFEPFVHGKVQMGRVYSVVGDANILSETQLRSALGINNGLAHGALAIRSGDLVVADTFLMSDADEGEVEASILFVAKTADRYEKVLFGGDKN